MNNLPKAMRIFGATAAMIICANANAAITSYTGLVSTILTVGSGGGAPGNQDLRITLQGVATQCNGTPWSYINTSDANYNAIVASILAARTMGVPVSLYTSPDSTGGGCHILYTIF